MSKIKSIDIGFENCEVVELLPTMFLRLEIKGIQKDYLINCFQYENGEVNEFTNCELFRITINKLGLQIKLDHSKSDLRERLRNKDIVSIGLLFEDGKSENIYVPWGKKDYTNTKEVHRMIKKELEIIIKQ